MICYHIAVIAQCNIVLNGGFELDNGVVSGTQGNISQAQGWGQGTVTTPNCENRGDYFIPGISSPVLFGVGSNPGYMPAPGLPSNQRFIGLYTNGFGSTTCGTSGSDVREYVGQNEMLCSNQKYRWEFNDYPSDLHNNVDNDFALWGGPIANVLPGNADPSNCPDLFTELASVTLDHTIPNSWYLRSTDLVPVNCHSSFVMGPKCGTSGTANGYVFLDNVSIKIIDEITLSTNDPLILQGQTATINLSIPGCYGPYDIEWQVENGPTTFLHGIENLDSIQVSPLYTTNYKVKSIVNSRGCQTPVDEIIKIRVLQTPDSCWNKTITICSDTMYNLDDLICPISNDYCHWSGEGVANNYINTGDLVGKKTIQFYNCDTAVEVNIINCDWGKKVFTPNSFTPNNDNMNDSWAPRFVNMSPTDYELIIRNKWGDVMYQSFNHTAKWDGMSSGKYVASDVYSYQVIYRKGTSKVIEKEFGTVVVIR